MGRPQRFDYMLQNGLTNWVKDSRQLSAALSKPQHFLRYKENDIIEVDLNLLTPGYQLKYVAPDPIKFVDLLLSALERAMFNTLSFIGIEDYQFLFTFKFQGEVIRRQVNYYFLSRSRMIKSE